MMPKIMHIMASTGLEIVMPTFFKLFSTTSVKLFHAPIYSSLIDVSFKIFKLFEIGETRFILSIEIYI